MKTLEETKQLIRDNIKRTVGEKNPIIGGQSCGVMPTKVTLFSEELDLKITVGHYRSPLTNANFAMKLIESAMDEIIGPSNS